MADFMEEGIDRLPLQVLLKNTVMEVTVLLIDHVPLPLQDPNATPIGFTGVTNGYFSLSDAQLACTALGATLTGFQNDNERMTVATLALGNLTARGGAQVAGLWLGATNLPGCRSPSCGPFNTFQWTDGHTTGVGGIKWGIGEPDGNNWPGPTACIQQFIISPNFVAGANEFAGWKGAFVNGDLDKYACVSPAYPYTRMYACGKVGVRQ
ncbi:hypothetical protein GCK72_019734 [Caenorhabditis remanei]|uniref:C-type lectin domain-containing protein n=1 Tax=Caenorhabditis remanei TaxID=31234 RepID=A0A6A5GDE8_CAERE|nr:hypothetical protein GCK72_019734 [Caenorhabditis remanei]KAF1753178.1 hypothetical protein GCK72_019734 [Caenorhabditis remanei]